ncbi:hypothetical protein STEG23_013784, partial [Scotinomys teguina]
MALHTVSHFQKQKGESSSSPPAGSFAPMMTQRALGPDCGTGGNMQRATEDTGHLAVTPELMEEKGNQEVEHPSETKIHPGTPQAMSSPDTVQKDQGYHDPQAGPCQDPELSVPMMGVKDPAGGEELISLLYFWK